MVQESITGKLTLNQKLAFRRITEALLKVLKEESSTQNKNDIESK